MAIIYLAGNRIEGLSSDTKPTSVVTGSIFYETDTKDEFSWSGSEWVKRTVGGTITGADVEDASIPFTKIAAGTPNKGLGFDENGDIAEVAAATGVDPTVTKEVVPFISDFREYVRPLHMEVGLNPDTNLSPRARRDYFSEGNRLTWSDDFSGGGLEWTHEGNNAYVSAQSLHLHTDYQSASAVDLYTKIGTEQNPLPLSTDQWCLRFSMEWSEVASNTTYVGYMYFGLSSQPATVFANQNQSFVGFTIGGHQTNAAFYNYNSWCYGGQAPYTASHTNTNVSNWGGNFHDIFYCELVRQGNTIFWRYYADPEYRVMVNEYSYQGAASYFNAETTTGNNQALRYLKVMGYCTATGERNYIQGKIDNVKFWNGCSYPDDHDTLNALEEVNKGAENYFNAEYAQWDNPTDCFIGQVAPNNTTITATNKWRKAWDDDYKYYSKYPTDTSDTYQMAEIWRTVSADRTNTVYGQGFYIASGNHPLVYNSANKYNEVGTKGRGSYGFPVKDISFYLYKTGSPLGNLVVRVFNGGGQMNTHHRCTSVNTIDVSTLSTDSANPTKCTWQMAGYTPRSGDYVIVEPECVYATTQATVIPTRLIDGTLNVNNNYQGQLFDGSNYFSVRYNRQVSDGLEYAGYHQNTSPTVGTDATYHPDYEVTLQRQTQTAQMVNPYYDIWVGFPWQGQYKRQANSQQYKRTTFDNMQNDNWGSSAGAGTGWSFTTPEHFYDKYRIDTTSGTAPALVGSMVIMQTEYAYATITVPKHKEHTYANPAYRALDTGYIDDRIWQMRIGGNDIEYEVWVSDNNKGDPLLYGSTNRDRIDNDWRRVGFGVGSNDDSYLYVNERFRYIRVYVNTHSYSTAPTSRWYYVHDHADIQYCVVGIGIQLADTNTETQIQIQESDPKLPDNHANKWTTVRTINTANLSSETLSKILVPASMTNKYRIKGSSGQSKVLGLREVRVCYLHRDIVRTKHGHIALSATDANLSLAGA